jgi:Domain of unknown function (DU1801)
MPTTDIDHFYLNQEEPNQSCLLALRDIILAQDTRQITVAWKYKLPFFMFRNKMFCYLWVRKKTKQPYIGIVEGYKIEHPDLIIEKRARMKIMLFDPTKDLPIDTISDVLTQAMAFYK